MTALRLGELTAVALHCVYGFGVGIVELRPKLYLLGFPVIQCISGESVTLVDT